MSYSAKIEEAVKLAFIISINKQMSIEQLSKLHEEDGIIFTCEDGAVIDAMEEEA